MKKLYLSNWLKNYATWRVKSLFNKSTAGTTHIIFLFVDHFELAGKEPRLSEWMLRYPRLASKHVDSDGMHPKHTWFYALHLLRESELEQLRCLVESGFGEIELHWHHDHDTPESFQEKLYEGLRIFQKHGFMLLKDDDKTGCFGFIHGNWSLNNSRGNEFCGIDNEIELLKQAGCYGDFTFPALHSIAQPNMINSIYYANFDRGFAGYANGRRSEVGSSEKADEFMIFGGPLTINWRDWRFKWHPMIENGEIGRSCTHGDPSV